MTAIIIVLFFHLILWIWVWTEVKKARREDAQTEPPRRRAKVIKLDEFEESFHKIPKAQNN